MKKKSLPKAVKVKKIIKENFKTKSFVLDEKIKGRPGQFIMVWLPEVAEKPFSLTNTNPLTFTAMSVGRFTKTLNTKIKPGDRIWYRGPFGNGWFKNKKGRKILVSGGCGCVPVFFFAKNLTEKDRKNTKAVIGAKNKKELLFEARFKGLGIKTIITTDNGSKGIKGYTTDVLEKELKKGGTACVYACGPEVMLRKVVELCKTYKTSCQVSLEAVIKCGFGICGSCSKGGKRVCKDGPVFSKWPGRL
jgi:dihydroorotate dehydrogenase electron transfer subunit